MAIVSKLISRVDACPFGTTIKTILRTGTMVQVTKLDSVDSVEITRQRPNNDKVRTILKKLKGLYQPKKVIEEYRFGIVTIEYKKDGSRLMKLRACDKDGRASSSNNGFYKTSLEKNLFAKGAKIQSPEAEMKIPPKDRNASIDFLLHLDALRHKDRYKQPTKDYTRKQNMIYREADLKNCK